jgi:hypothetical protein
MNFNDVLNKKAADIEAPPLLPAGTYTMKVAKVPSMDTKTTDKGSWDIIEFTLLPVSAQEDVDQEALAKYGPFGPASAQRLSFMFNKEDQVAFDRTLFNLKRFLLDHLQIGGDDNSSVKELMDQTVGQQCDAFIRWEPDRNNPETIYARISKTAPSA